MENKNYVKDSVEMEIAEQNTKSGYRIVNFLVFSIIVGTLSFLGFFGYEQYNKLNERISEVGNTKDAVLGNTNSTKGTDISKEIVVSIGSEKVVGGNLELIKKEIANISSKFTDKAIKFELISDNSKLYEESFKWKDFGYYINTPEIMDTVKNNVIAGKYEQEIDLSKFSYIDIDSLYKKQKELIQKQTVSSGKIEFNTASGFTLSSDNYSYYSIKFLSGGVVPPELGNPKDINVKLEFVTEKTNYQEQIDILNKKLAKIKDFKVNIVIPSKNNEKNLAKLKEFVGGSGFSAGKDGAKIAVNSSDIMKGISFDGYNIVYKDVEYFKDGLVSISSSDTNIVASRSEMFELGNPNINDNYPSSSDFVRVSYENGGDIDFSEINSKVNAYVKYHIWNNFEREEKDIVATVIKGAQTNPFIEIESSIGGKIEIVDKKAGNSIFSKKTLFSSASPLKIKDAKNLVASYVKKEIAIDSIVYSEGSVYEIAGDKCIITSILESSFDIKCKNSDTLNVIYSDTGNIEKNGSVVTVKFNSNEGSYLIYDSKKTAIITYSVREKNLENLLGSLSEYVKLDKSVIDSISYSGNEFSIYFKKSSFWYIKSDMNKDIALIYLISVKDN